jgi:hypothetical protein
MGPNRWSYGRKRGFAFDKRQSSNQDLSGAPVRTSGGRVHIRRRRLSLPALRLYGIGRATEGHSICGAAAAGDHARCCMFVAPVLRRIKPFKRIGQADDSSEIGRACKGVRSGSDPGGRIALPTVSVTARASAATRFSLPRAVTLLYNQFAGRYAFATVVAFLSAVTP